jgi:hypothetical protein
VRALSGRAPELTEVLAHEKLAIVRRAAEAEPERCTGTITVN